MIAQGNALGIDTSNKPIALKGRHNFLCFSSSITALQA
jgi:hypothetical protein